jgi:hypothetical protein
LNHARAHPVSWVVSHVSPLPRPTTQDLAISLVIRTPTPAGAELLNNYGPKPNSELILGYGFSLSHNPDDTMVLSVGGGSAGQSSSEQGAKREWEVGRNARGVEGLWEQVVKAMSQASGFGSDGDGGNIGDEDEDVKWVGDQLDAAGMLSHMCQAYLDRLPGIAAVDKTPNMRPQVRLMLEHYLKGVWGWEGLFHSYSEYIYIWGSGRSARHLGIHHPIRAGERRDRYRVCSAERYSAGF